MRHVFSGVLWIGIYCSLVLAPLLVPAPRASAARQRRVLMGCVRACVGFLGIAMLGVQLVLTARFRRASAPFGLDILYYFHRYMALWRSLFLFARTIS